MKKLVLCLFAATCSALSARAAFVCVAPTSTVAGSIQITAPISFTITTTGTAAVFDLSNWVTSDGSQTFTPALSPNLAFSLNGTMSSQTAVLVDNFTSSVNSVGPNDGYFLFNGGGVAVTAGNVLTLLAGTYTIPAKSGFNPQCTQTFTGTMFVTDSAGVRLSAVVPEPSTWALLGVGIGALGLNLCRRRRFNGSSAGQCQYR